MPIAAHWLWAAWLLTLVGFFAGGSFVSPGSKRQTQRVLRSPLAPVSGRILLDGAGYDTAPDGTHFNGTGISALCAKTAWVPDLWLWCDGIEGGVTNVRSGALNCLRYAMEIGAGLILPSLRLRGALKNDDVSLSSGGRGGLDTYFDLFFFKDSLGLYCNQMPLVDSLEDIPKYQTASFPDPIRTTNYYKLSTGKEPDTSTIMVNAHANTFRRDFEFVMGETIGLKVVRFPWTLYFEWPIRIDEEVFWRNFGRLLTFKPELQAYASTAYAALQRLTPKFYGCHLRTEADVPAGWTTFDNLVERYVTQVEASALDVLYIAGGNYADIEKVRQAAAPKGITVVHKGTLLPPHDLRTLSLLTFDQQASVDYLVLLQSTLFSGVAASSFSQNLAISRHTRSLASDTPYHFYGDELSVLITTTSHDFFGLTVWP